MAVPPRFAAQKLVLGSSPTKAIHLDYVCPFSAKMFNTIYTSLLPRTANKPYSNKVQFLFRQQIQPWHPSSTLVHEAGVAVLRLAPSKFWEFSSKLMESQKEYFDVAVVNESRNETYKRLAKLGAGVGVDEGRMMELLKVPERSDRDGGMNIGNGVTDDLKVLIKIARLTGIHVSPTVVFDGVVENSISSGFTADQWDEWLTKNCSE